MAVKFSCSALSLRGEVFELETCGPEIMAHAIEHFKSYVRESGGEWGEIIGLSLTFMEVDS